MPLYEYECCQCSRRFERKQRFDEEPVAICPRCGGEVRRVIFPVGIIFKGNGFYSTDHRRSTVGTLRDEADMAEPTSAEESEKDAEVREKFERPAS